MGKVAIDFKINNTHNNTGQLLIFIYLFITSYPSLLVRGSLSHQMGCLLGFFLANVPFFLSFFLFHRSQLTLHNCLVSLFAYFTGVSARQTCCEENLPQSIEATCASWPLQLRLGSRCWLLPACTQWSVRQRSRGNGGINDYL